MAADAFSILGDGVIRAELARAWRDSLPGPSGGHEEGGFICRAVDGSLSVDRWPVGLKDEITIPPHPGCRRNNEPVVATFHTHPNTGPDYLQSPGRQDCSAVRDDPDLKGPEYVGEFVISSADVYLIAPTGIVTALGNTSAFLTLSTESSP